MGRSQKLTLHISPLCCYSRTVGTVATLICSDNWFKTVCVRPAGGLGCVTSWIVRGSKGKGGMRRKGDRDNQKDSKAQTERQRWPETEGQDGPGWHCFDYSGKVKCSFQQRGLPCHSRGCWRGVMATNSMVLNVLTYFHCRCDITLMTCLLMSIQCLPGMKKKKKQLTWLRRYSSASIWSLTFIWGNCVECLEIDRERRFTASEKQHLTTTTQLHLNFVMKWMTAAVFPLLTILQYFPFLSNGAVYEL